MLAVATTVSTYALVSALWGLGASFVAEIAKQDSLPKPVNTIIADAVVVISAALATLTEASWSWHNFGAALVFTVGAALANHTFFLAPTGVGAALQSATSWPAKAGTPVEPSAEEQISTHLAQAAAYHQQKMSSLEDAATLIATLLPPHPPAGSQPTIVEARSTRPGPDAIEKGGKEPPNPPPPPVSQAAPPAPPSAPPDTALPEALVLAAPVVPLAP